MQKVFEELTIAFRKHGGVLQEEQYKRIVTKHTTLLEDSETIFILLQASGYPIAQDDSDQYRLETCFTSHAESTLLRHRHRDKWMLSRVLRKS